MPESPFPAAPFNVPTCPRCGGMMRNTAKLFHTGERVLICDIDGAVEPRWITVDEEPE
jgi:hypothetical protein